MEPVMEVNTLAVVIGLAILIVGPGSGVWIGLRAAQKAERELRQVTTETLEKTGARIEDMLGEMLHELRELNHRMTRAEGDIRGLEKREEDG